MERPDFSERELEVILTMAQDLLAGQEAHYDFPKDSNGESADPALYMTIGQLVLRKKAQNVVRRILHGNSRKVTVTMNLPIDGESNELWGERLDTLTTWGEWFPNGWNINAEVTG